MVEDDLESVLEEKSALRIRVQDDHSPTLTLFKNTGKKTGDLVCFVWPPKYNHMMKSCVVIKKNDEALCIGMK